MSFAVTPHLNFRGQARAALEFYGRVFEAAPVVMTYGDLGQPALAASPDDVIWGQVATADGFRIMAFDVQAGRAFERGTNSFFVSLQGHSADEVRARWQGLSDGGTVLQELAPSAWSALYGMVTDRFGITWIVDVATPGAH